MSKTKCYSHNQINNNIKSVEVIKSIVKESLIWSDNYVIEIKIIYLHSKNWKKIKSKLHQQVMKIL